ncbi:MAG: 50S ribosomal protein L24 [Promethearchaeota archaeon]
MKIKSKQPSKQRKALSNYRNHQRSKLLSTRVADFLRDEYGIKRLPLRVGDHARIIRGEFSDFEGEVIEITKNQRAKIKEAQFDKTDGTQFHPAIHISNLVITKFAKEKKMDPWRANMIERKALFGFYEEELKAPKKEKEEEK